VVISPDVAEVSEYSSVVDDGTGTYKLYYLVAGDEWHMAFATSTDGLRWEFPNLRLIEYTGSLENNFVIRRAAAGTVLFDPHDPDPQHRYKYLSEYTIDNEPDTPTTEGVVIYTSPDGIRFTKHDYPLFPGVTGSQGTTSRTAT
jgi:hypothetical protein